MNKLYLFFFLGYFNQIGLAQRWVDSIEIANKAYRNKDYITADRIYSTNYKNAKNKGGIDEEIAQSKYRQRDFNGAIQYYKKKLSTVTSNAERARIKRNIGNALFEKGKYKDAINAYKESIKLNPKDEETRYNLSQAIRQQQNKQNQPKNKPKQPQKNNDNTNNNKKQNQEQNKPKKNNNNQPKTPSSGGNLPKKDVERKLDELAKKEGETRRRMSKQKHGKSSQNQHRKDW